MERALISEKLLEELNDLSNKIPKVIKRCDLSIRKCRDLIYRFKKQISNFTFKNVEAEINFFKFIKQVPLSNLVYYSELRSFEIQFPVSNQEIQKEYIQKKMGKINRFFRYNLDFVQYIEQNKTGLATKKWTFSCESCSYILIKHFVFKFFYSFIPQSGVYSSSIIPSFYPLEDGQLSF